MSLSEAVKEAYASNPIDDIVYDTIEIHHPTFIDEFGERMAVRVVRSEAGYQDPIEFRLEDDAPVNPGEFVTFQPIPLSMTAPGFQEDSVPTLQLAISNVSREITKYLEMAIQQTDPITIIYRVYLDSDRSESQINPPITMSLSAATAGVMQVTGTATLSDVHNWPFPFPQYTPERFPGLVR